MLINKDDSGKIMGIPIIRQTEWQIILIIYLKAMTDDVQPEEVQDEDQEEN